MLVAAVVLALGLFTVSAVTQYHGLRLGGAVVVPIMALYTLKNFVTLPVFLLSFGLAYAALWAAKQYTLVFGRTELTVAIVAGSLLPLVMLFGAEVVGLGGLTQERAVLFLGSVLPGLAAYNLQQLKPEYRSRDVGYAVSLFLGLVALGSLLVDPRLAPTLATHTPLVLFAETSDIAVLRGAAVAGELYPVLLPRALAVGLLVAAFLSSEAVRSRYGVRAGVVSMGLLAIYATASTWLLTLFLLDLVVVVFVVSVLHWTTLLYGRVLVGVGSGVAALVTVPLVVTLPVVRGLSALFVALLAGTTAYNVHVTAPRERRMRVPLALVLFAPLFLLARVLGEPYETGLLSGVPMSWVAVVALVLAVGSVLLLERQRIEPPDDEEVLSASVLSGGEG